MFSVFTGSGRDARNYLAAQAPPDEQTVWIEADARFELTHLLLRRLLPHLRRRFGSRRVETALARHTPALSLIFGELARNLTPQQRALRDRFCARLDSNITHNLTVALPMVTHCCELIVELLDGERLVLVFPDVGNLDWCSQQVLKVLFKDFSECKIDCMLGFAGRATVMEKSGIVFRYSNPVVKSFIFSFRTVADFSVLALVPQEEVALETVRLRDTYDDDLEQHALEIAYEGHIDTHHAAMLLQVMEASFESYGYTTALYLGTKLLEAGLPMSSGKLARVHGIVALTAHNRQFFAEGNPRLATFLQHHYEAALANEREPAHRICLHYRLAVTHARRKRELEPAARYVRDGLNELAQSTIKEPQRSSLDAWLRNIHSFVLMHQRNFPLAVEEHEVAFARLSKMEPSGLWANEVVFSTAVLAENLGLLFNLAGDVASSRHWYGIEERLSKKWPVLDAVPDAEWQNFYARNFMLKEAANHAVKGVDKAAATFHFNLEYFFILTLADLYFRMGKVSPSLDYFERAVKLQSMSESSYGTPFLLRSGAASIALKAGEPERAQAHLDLLASEELDTACRCRVRCLQASVHAVVGDSGSAEAAINEAIEDAVDHGEQNLLVQVATRAGEVCLLLHQPDAAGAAFRQGWDLSGLGEVEAPDLLPTTTFTLFLGMLNSGQGTKDILERAIEKAPLALARSREPWWLLSDLLRHIDSFQGQTWMPPPHLADAMAKIRIAANQRDDCSELLCTWGQESSIVA